MNSAEIIAHYQALSSREKVLIFTSGSALILALMFLLLLEPQYLDRVQALDDFSRSKAVVEDNQRQSEQLKQVLAMDPTASMQEQLRQLQSQQSALSAAIDSRKVAVLTPVELTEFLSIILQSVHSLNIEDFQLVSEAYSADEDDEQSSFLIKQKIALQLQGSKQNIEKYLQFLEQGPVSIYWDNLRYQRLSGDDASVNLQLHLFSARE
ncbi:MAG: hypothetical protein OFPI_33310 [Osedax symbiont Rs2]|nr:MAG: hypothetical protein OFPI_33310 [Osedax symbiont Rs2]